MSVDRLGQDGLIDHALPTAMEFFQNAVSGNRIGGCVFCLGVEVGLAGRFDGDRGVGISGVRRLARFAGSLFPQEPHGTAIARVDVLIPSIGLLSTR